VRGLSWIATTSDLQTAQDTGYEAGTRANPRQSKKGEAMTLELHCIIVKAGCKALLKMTEEDLRTIDPRLTKSLVRGVLNNPHWRDPDRESPMALIQLIAGRVKAKS
jgi:hypothetical protein